MCLVATSETHSPLTLILGARSLKTSWNVLILNRTMASWLMSSLGRNTASASRAFTRALATSSPHEPATHYKITLRRSAISLGDRIKGTLESLGIHRRNQTVFFPHSPIVAGKILAVKELVDVENVPESQVLTKEQQTLLRRPKRGYTVVSSHRTEL